MNIPGSNGDPVIFCLFLICNVCYLFLFLVILDEYGLYSFAIEDMLSGWGEDIWERDFAFRFVIHQFTQFSLYIPIDAIELQKAQNSFEFNFTFYGFWMYDW